MIMIQKLIDAILKHNSKLIQAHNVFSRSNSGTRKTTDKSISNTTENKTFRNDKKNEPNVQKDNKMEELHVSLKNLYTETHQRKAEKKKIVSNGDSIVKNVDGWDVSRGDSVKIRPHPRGSTEDLVDHIKPAIRKKPDIADTAVFHTGSNDLQNNCNIVK